MSSSACAAGLVDGRGIEQGAVVSGRLGQHGIGHDGAAAAHADRGGVLVGEGIQHGGQLAAPGRPRDGTAAGMHGGEIGHVQRHGLDGARVQRAFEQLQGPDRLEAGPAVEGARGILLDDLQHQLAHARRGQGRELHLDQQPRESAAPLRAHDAEAGEVGARLAPPHQRKAGRLAAGHQHLRHAEVDIGAPQMSREALLVEGHRHEVALVGQVPEPGQRAARELLGGEDGDVGTLHVLVCTSCDAHAGNDGTASRAPLRVGRPGKGACRERWNTPFARCFSPRADLS